MDLTDEQAEFLGRVSPRVMALARNRQPNSVPEQQLVDAFVRTPALGATVKPTLAVIASSDEPGILSPIAEITWSESQQPQLDLALRLLGPEATAGAAVDSGWTNTALRTRGEIIYGGTSQTQRNSIAKAFGLPSDR